MALHQLSSDVIGVITGFLPASTEHQQPLLLVNHNWYQGVVQQDGMKPMSDVNWPWDALQQRQSRRLKLHSKGSAIHLVQLSEFMPNVESLNVSSCCKLTSSGLEILQAFRNLRRLNISDLTLGNNHLRLIGEHCKQLHELDVSRNSFITDAGLKHITNNLVELTTFSCAFCSCFTDVGMEYIGGQLLQLTALNIHHCNGVTNAGIAALVQLQGLTSLDISNMQKVCCAEHLAKMNNLEVLHCCDAIYDLGLGRLSQIPTLKMLYLEDGKQITNEGFESISALTNLHVFHCRRMTKLCSQVFEHVSQCEKLTELSLEMTWRPSPSSSGSGGDSGDTVLQQDMEYLANLKNLTRLSLVSFYISEAALRAIVSLPLLNTLILRESVVDDDGLVHLAKLKQLQTLDLYECECSPVLAVDYLTASASVSRSLTALDLSTITSITDEGLRKIATKFKSLKNLSLSFNAFNDDDESEITDDGLLSLLDLPRLERLVLEGHDGLTADAVNAIKERVETVQWDEW